MGPLLSSVCTQDQITDEMAHSPCAGAARDRLGKSLQAALRSNAPPQLTWFYEPRPDPDHSTIYARASPTVFRKVFAKESHGHRAAAQPEQDKQ